MKLKYLPPLDGLRACAFGLVFVAHAGLGDFVPGGLGVTIFFFLSGYLITSLMRAEWSETGHISLRNFYLRRCFRILPPLYLVLIITCLFDHFSIPSHQTTWLGITSVLFYFFNYAELTHLIAWALPSGLEVVWSLMIEEHFYLLFPFIYLLILRRSLSKRKTVAIFLSACGAALVWRFVLVFFFHTPLDSPSLSWTYSATDARFDSILWGSVLAIGANPWCGDKVAILDRNKGFFAFGGLLLLALSIIIREPHYRETLRYTLQGVALLPIFYYVAAMPGGWQTRWLTWPPLRWLGVVSYTMYLSHLFILSTLRFYLIPHDVIIALAALVISGCFAEIVRRTIENPSRRFMKKVADSRTSLPSKPELQTAER
ncbi:peptidoglycan/LPS O-acetylase OafA/YrhL [Silvibacterium bohemicum]|uniref:Peptidoglycan/LPS O-acetylase OafA/YrhL n=1 Tax=Silvibacterium bohemicum TaxID=1577686 RepID=A0A841JNR4_9BACT|nr:acyltransferase [Silvibacterium bohemicum]MBB6142790.1 peptidoglycan/LPS O-acetylase OafA/YrhL [Silvibacterium bohemicum]